MGASTSKDCAIHQKDRQDDMDSLPQCLGHYLGPHQRISCEAQNDGNPRSTPFTRETDDDVVFHVGQDTMMRIAAKKSVLAQKNDVFFAMFYGAYTQSHQQDQLRHRRASPSIDSECATHHIDQIYDSDVDGRAFKNLISFLNGEAVELRSVVTAVETLHAAEKYLCEGLMKICVTYLAGQLNVENVLQIYQRIRVYSPECCDQSGQPSAPSLDEIAAPEPGQQQQLVHSPSTWCSFLLNSCLDFIDKNASRVLSSEEFEELGTEEVELIVSRDQLRVSNESQVLTALLRWSVFECHRRQLDPNAHNQRLVLGGLLWHVRFFAMPVKELWSMPVLSQLLTRTELSSMMAFMTGQLAVDLLPDHIRIRLPGMAQPRNYLPAESGVTSATSGSPSEPLPSSCRKSCMTEKFFVCLACIFE